MVISMDACCLHVRYTWLKGFLTSWVLFAGKFVADLEMLGCSRSSRKLGAKAPFCDLGIHSQLPR